MARDLEGQFTGNAPAPQNYDPTFLATAGARCEHPVRNAANGNESRRQQTRQIEQGKPRVVIFEQEPHRQQRAHKVEDPCNYSGGNAWQMPATEAFQSLVEIEGNPD